MARRAQRVSPAVIRIPKPDTGTTIAPTAPKLFVDEGARQSLERKLRGAYQGRAVVLSITDNRHSLVVHHAQSSVLFVRLHHMFLDAPANVSDALVRYIVCDDQEAGKVVDEYIALNLGARRRKGRPSPYNVKGDHHDLTEIYDSLNERYFDGSVHALIAWGRHTPKRKGATRKQIRLGSYDHDDRLITINPTLDRDWVPRYFIAYVVFHEMLHHVYPPCNTDERRELHSEEFLNHEREFRWYERALKWEEKNISRLLRSS